MSDVGKTGGIWPLIERMPARFYIRAGVERSEDGEFFMTAVIMETPPDGGWRSRGAYFGHPLDAETHNVPCPEQWCHDDVARLSISAETAKEAERLTVGMVADFLERMR